MDQGYVMKEPTVSVCITTHQRLEQLKNALYFVKNQTYPIKEIKIYASGYKEGELDDLGVEVSYEQDWKDWGHHKRAKAFKELTGDYIWTVCDDDQYPFTFLERMFVNHNGEDIIYCNFGTKTRPHYWVKSMLHRGYIGNGNILVSKKIASITPYVGMSYSGDWTFIEDCLKNKATSRHVDEGLYFHN